MTFTHLFGYLLITLSAVLLALHWHGLRGRQRGVADPFGATLFRRRLQASALIGVIGAAIAILDRIPKTPVAMLFYLACLLIAWGMLLALGVADLRAIRRHARQVSEEKLLAELRRRVVQSKDE